MKRFRAFVLAMLILFMCTACKKETLPATQPRQRTDSGRGDGADCFRRFRPHPGCAVPIGPHGAGGDDGGHRTAAVFRRSRPDRQYDHRQCGRTASNGSGGILHTGTRLHRAGTSDFSGRPCRAGGAGRGAAVLHRIASRPRTANSGCSTPTDRTRVLDEALSGVSNLTAMAVQDEALLLAADGSYVHCLCHGRNAPLEAACCGN